MNRSFWLEIIYVALKTKISLNFEGNFQKTEKKQSSFGAAAKFRFEGSRFSLCPSEKGIFMIFFGGRADCGFQSGKFHSSAFSHSKCFIQVLKEKLLFFRLKTASVASFDGR